MRTRFAPSPTGYLHVGGLRTALYAYLVAKQAEGTFLLRIEDTDKSREVAGAINHIIEGLMWAGMEPEEGVTLKDGVVTQIGSHGPYIQSERLDLYKKYAQELIDSGNAYYAFDTTEELDQMRKQEQERGNPSPAYNARIRMQMKNSITLSADDVKKRMDAGEPYVIRMKVPETQMITFVDDIRGEVSFQGKTIDDQVLMKSDGFPTYHLAHVVDDHLMDIDVVIRGEEWLPSTPKHLLLFQFLGWQAPRYAHLPLLLNADRSKLSKRQGDVSVSEYIEKGYLPEAMINFIALLGWNPGTTQDIFTMRELTEQFSLDRVQKAGAVFDLEKLDWLQGQWMRKLTLDEFVKRIEPFLRDELPEALQDRHLSKKASLVQERITFFKEAPEMLSYFYRMPKIDLELLASKKQRVSAENLPKILMILISALGSIPEEEWREELIEGVIEFSLLCQMATKQGNTIDLSTVPLPSEISDILKNIIVNLDLSDFKKGQLLWPLRATLTGRDFSPGAYEVAAVLGKEETLKRLEAAKTLL